MTGTPPLTLLPIEADQLRALIRGAQHIGPHEVEPGALPPDFILTGALQDLAAQGDPFWALPRAFVTQEDGRVLGVGGFKGAPDEGRIEIGYGVAESARGRGVATTAVRLLLEEAAAHPAIHTVLAETLQDNTASRRVLEKAGFYHLGQRYAGVDGTLDCWVYALAP